MSMPERRTERKRTAEVCVSFIALLVGLELPKSYNFYATESVSWNFSSEYNIVVRQCNEMNYA